MFNPLKLIARGVQQAGKGAWKGMRVAYHQATRPEVMAALQIGGMLIPGLNALGMLSFLQMAKQAERQFPGRGTGGQKVKHVFASFLKMTPQLKAWGMPTSEWKHYLEGAVLMMQGRASLVRDVDGKELLDENFDELAALFEAGEGTT